MKRRAKRQPEPALVHRVEIDVRFSETDAMGVVWHGNYLKFFEDGREAFGRAFGIDYLTIYRSGYTAPVVELDCQYKASVTFGDRLIIETGYIPTPAAKLCFVYTIRHAETGSLVATGSTTQVFVGAEGVLELNSPPFYQAWKEQWHVDL